MGMPPGTSYPQAPQYAQQYVQQYVQPAATKPSAFWVLTVISFLCSFLVGGVAMFFSYQVGERWKAGNVAGARKASQLALWIGLAGIVIGIIFIAALNSAGDSSGY